MMAVNQRRRRSALPRLRLMRGSSDAQVEHRHMHKPSTEVYTDEVGEVHMYRAVLFLLHPSRACMIVGAQSASV